jgi:hypothetical protein
MTRPSLFVLFIVAAAAAGCSDAPGLHDAPISVSGRLSHGGRPVGNVAVWFQPLDRGHLRSFPVGADGTFAGKLVGGAYSYYVGPSSARNAAATLKTVPTQFYEPDMGRSIQVEPGKQMVLALD